MRTPARPGAPITPSPSSALPGQIERTTQRGSLPVHSTLIRRARRSGYPGVPDSGEWIADQLGASTVRRCGLKPFSHLGLDPGDPNRPLEGDEAIKLGALRRKPLSTTVYGLDGSGLQSKPYSVTLHTYDSLLVPSGLGDGNQVAVPYATTSTEQRWERQDAMLSTRLIEYLAVNEEGDVTLQRTRAQRSGTATPDQDVTTKTTFATGGKNLRVPARTTQTGRTGR